MTIAGFEQRLTLRSMTNAPRQLTALILIKISLRRQRPARQPDTS
jgi:hypothetical protein